MHGPADDVPDWDGDEGDWPEENPLDRPQDWTGASNVQQVDEAVLPALHRYVVDAVLLGVSRRLPIIRTEDVLAKLPVDGCTHEKNHETNDECSHE